MWIHNCCQPAPFVNSSDVSIFACDGAPNANARASHVSYSSLFLIPKKSCTSDTTSGFGFAMIVPWFCPSTAISGAERRSLDQSEINTLFVGFTGSSCACHLKSSVTLRVFSAQPAHRTVPSHPGEFATAEIPLYGTFPIKTATYGVPSPLSYSGVDPTMSLCARSQVYLLASSSPSSTMSPAFRKSGPKSWFPLTKAPSQLRPFFACGEPKVAGASPTRCFSRRTLLRSSFGA